jgi:hypothetical protein
VYVKIQKEAETDQQHIETAPKRVCMKLRPFNLLLILVNLTTITYTIRPNWY